jgi:hypothetical protein
VSASDRSSWRACCLYGMGATGTFVSDIYRAMLGIAVAALAG